MIAHQTVVEKPQGREALLIADDQVEEVAAVLDIGKDRFAVMAAIHEVVAGGRRLLKLAWRAGHGRPLSLLGYQPTISPFSAGTYFIHKHCSCNDLQRLSLHARQNETFPFHAHPFYPQAQLAQ